MSRRNPDESNVATIASDAFARGFELGQCAGSTVEQVQGEVVEVVENPSRATNKLIREHRQAIINLHDRRLHKGLTQAQKDTLMQEHLDVIKKLEAQTETVENPISKYTVIWREDSRIRDKAHLSLAAARRLAQSKSRRFGTADIREPDGLYSHKQYESWINGYSANRKRNPESGSAELYRDFHGKDSESITEYEYEEHEHENLAQLGELTSLTVVTTTGFEVTIQAPPASGPINEVVQLCSSEDRKQLYFVGGNQEMDVTALDFKGAQIKDLMLIGVLTMVEYYTQKKFHKFKLTDYYHALGEETGEQPALLYDPLSKLMRVAGGAYEVKDVGIVN